MSFLRRPLSGTPRWRFVGLLLVLTLVLAGVLAYEAWRAARSHRAVATSALEDHATFVAWQFADRAQSKLDHLVVSPGLWYAVSTEPGERGGGDPGSGAAAPAVAASAAAGADEAAGEGPPPGRTAPEYVRYAFDVDLSSGTIEAWGPEPPSPAVTRWISDTLATEAAETYQSDWSHAAVAGGAAGRQRLLFYKVEFAADGSPCAARGFEVDPDGWRTAFGYALDYPLLPPSLTEGAANADVLSVRVLDPAGQVLFASSPAYPSDFAARDEFAPQFGGLRTDVALRPGIADRLLIGGLPRSRLPVVLGLLALTGLLVAGAIVLLRREMELARLRTEFVSNVSHELRTPLAQIRMFAETLLLGRIRSEEEEERGLEIIDQEARRLSALVENILLFSRAERSSVRIKPEPTDVESLLRETLDAFRPLADAREADLRLDVHEPVTARVDPGSLRQMAINFLDNAVKYGPPGQRVVLGLRRAGSAYRVWVDDEGPGIPPDDRDGVWDAFSRLTHDEESAVAGTGIGLSVVRELAQQHGGRTWVEEAPSGGARFVLELPRDPDVAAGEDERGDGDEEAGRAAGTHPEGAAPGDGRGRPGRGDRGGPGRRHAVAASSRESETGAEVEP